jgi:hypothetical protein
MLQISAFNKNGKWYKGNLHCHTTSSDGILSPEEVCRLYREGGYNFLALTDHRLFTYRSDLESEKFIIIPGVEMDRDEEDGCKCHHVVGLCGPENGKLSMQGERMESPGWEGINSVQKMIDNMSDKGLHNIYCHPVWSRVEFEDFKDLSGYFAIELYNHGCEVENHTGYSLIYWDSLLRRGRRIWGAATDDAHHRLKDQMGGWVMVNADCLEHKAIIEALIAGRFYSSNGPEIYDFGVRDEEAYIVCSPAKEIHFVAYDEYGKSFFAGSGKTITSAGHKLKGTERYVRAECMDENGKTAWTNPIFI